VLLIRLLVSCIHKSSTAAPENAEFIDKVYTKVKASDKFQEVYTGKKVVIVLDNAPCHNQTEALIAPHDDLVILRIAPYSPMCNPIEGCFSVLKALVKDYLCFHREQVNPTMQDLADGKTMTDFSRDLLERAALAGLAGLIPALIVAQELHARDAVNAPLRWGIHDVRNLRFEISHLSHFGWGKSHFGWRFRVLNHLHKIHFVFFMLSHIGRSKSQFGRVRGRTRDFVALGHRIPTPIGRPKGREQPLFFFLTRRHLTGR
jgi:transposase